MKKHEKLLKIPRFSVSRFILFDHLSNDESAEKRTLKRLNIFDRKFVYFDFILRKLSREMDETNDNIWEISSEFEENLISVNVYKCI